MLAPLDMHAHIEPGIAPSELDRLGACVVAVTRTLAEYEQVVGRRDRSVLWAPGCHPGLARSLREFSPEAFATLTASAAVVGEVGLDGSARVPLSRQREVFEDVVRTLLDQPRLASVHSYRATAHVLEILERHQPIGVVLHWWLGDERETRRAVALGAYFSVNASQVSHWSAIHAVPPDRLLTETDHPFGDRREHPPRRPGNVATVERALSAVLGVRVDEVRKLVWRNLRGLVDNLQVNDLLPHRFQVQLLAA
jgi:TatD DNase family protein